MLERSNMNSFVPFSKFTLRIRTRLPLISEMKIVADPEKFHFEFFYQIMVNKLLSAEVGESAVKADTQHIIDLGLLQMAHFVTQAH